LMAVHCASRCQTPTDFTVLVSVSENLMSRLASRARRLLQTCPDLEPGTLLSRRQKDVLRLVAQNLTNKEIAQRLNLSERTVKFHVSALLGKFAVRRRIDLVLEVDRRQTRRLNTVPLHVVPHEPESPEPPPLVASAGHAAGRSVGFAAGRS
jgi:DNA-binding NarL/FixJ family response regulator